MSSNSAMTLMSVIEFLLTALLSFLFFRKRLQRRFPVMGSYLVVRLVSAPLFSALLYESMRSKVVGWYIAYFFLYWGIYIASAILLFFICTEVFRTALSGFSGLARLGIIAFRWAAVVSVIITLSSATVAHKGFASLPDVAIALMRSVGILELCLLGFLCLSMNALKLSYRDLVFGIALGFGVMASNDFIIASLSTSHYTSLTAPMQFLYQSVILFVLTVWAIYVTLPEPERKPLVIPASSTIYRWNEIASALGHSTTKVAVPQPANGFFLTDVEKVVEKVLARNLQESESNS